MLLTVLCYHCFCFFRPSDVHQHLLRIIDRTILQNLHQPGSCTCTFFETCPVFKCTHDTFTHCILSICLIFQYGTSYKKLKTLIPVKGKYEKQFLNNIFENLEGICSEQPDISYDELCNRIGTPTDLIIEYYENADAEYVIQTYFFHHS